MSKGHLVLSRRVDESLTLSLSPNIDSSTPIGDVFDKIEITVQSITTGQVKLSINASKDVQIIRNELLDGQSV